MKKRALFPAIRRCMVVLSLIAAFVLSAQFVSSGAAQSGFAIKSLTCDNWMYDPGNEDQVWMITVTLTEPAIADVQIQLTSDRPDIVTWTTIYAAPSDGRVRVLQGQPEGALFLNSDFQPVATTITVSASDGTKTFTCQAVIPKKVNTPTPVVTPNLTPTATPTPLPPPKLVSMRMQTGSRSGNPSGIRICLDRDAPGHSHGNHASQRPPRDFPGSARNRSSPRRAVHQLQRSRSGNPHCCPRDGHRDVWRAHVDRHDHGSPVPTVGLHPNGQSRARFE